MHVLNGPTLHRIKYDLRSKAHADTAGQVPPKEEQGARIMTIESYRKYRRKLKTTPFTGLSLDYDWNPLPSSLDAAWLPYSLMLGEFHRELANSLNELADYTHRLAAWRDKIAHLNDKEKLDDLIEFINPLATLALNLPYVIRSRFIFATAHLSHQANKAKPGPVWKDDFGLDEEVYFDKSDAHGKDWKRYKHLKLKMEGIGNKAYKKATKDFRNAYNHRFSPRIEVGLTHLVTRHVNPDGTVSYGVGGSKPLKLTEVVPLLEDQCNRCYLTFEAFKALAQEQADAIISYVPPTKKPA